ncbi:DUF4385 domain-containing protein [Variibacter gotjawalensis]|nr:DUF4385 domain-containing protein [Variibacter gotjawalensis]NIK49817.1 hypothetical protein [Variibacter gotjawalensis]
MSAKTRPASAGFNAATYAWKPGIDYRARPEKYRVGKGEQGVLICEPYKSEIAPHWRFASAAAARRSARTIFKMFTAYLKADDFVGADLARKFLQMGYTRSRRYANYKGGRKYDKQNDDALFKRGTGDPEKAKSAEIFRAFWKKAEANKSYAALKAEWKGRFG